MAILPITPGQVISRHTKILDKVIEVWNKLIEDNYNHTNKISIINEEVAVEALMLSLNINENSVYKLGYLNIEEVYKKHGWTITYRNHTKTGNLLYYFRV